MKWRTKWVAAIIISVTVIGLSALEERGMLAKPVTQYITTGKDFIVMKKWVSSMFAKEDSITVSAGEEIEMPFAEFESMQPYKEGVLLTYPAAMPVTASADGLVVFTGFTRQSGKTVTVLYDNGDEVTYGFVGKLMKLPYSTVKKGDTLALMEEEAIYLTVKREGVKLDATSLSTYFSEDSR